MPPFFMPEMMPSPLSATTRTAAASVTIENTTSEAAATARGVGASRMPAAIKGSAFCLLRFQPVTAWPAAMSRGAMPAAMAPRPTKPMFMRSPRWRRVSRAQRSMSEREWCAADLGPLRVAVPDQRCTAPQVLRAAPRPGHVNSDCGRSLDHDLDQVAGIGVVVGSKPVEDAKALDRAVSHRHAARQALARVTACGGLDLDVQRLCRLPCRQRHGADGAGRSA